MGEVARALQDIRPGVLLQRWPQAGQSDYGPTRQSVRDRWRPVARCAAPVCAAATGTTSRVLKLLHFNDVYNVEARASDPVGGAARFVSKCLELREVRLLRSHAHSCRRACFGALLARFTTASRSPRQQCVRECASGLASITFSRMHCVRRCLCPDGAASVTSRMRVTGPSAARL